MYLPNKQEPQGPRPSLLQPITPRGSDRNANVRASLRPGQLAKPAVTWKRLGSTVAHGKAYNRNLTRLGRASQVQHMASHQAQLGFGGCPSAERPLWKGPSLTSRAERTSSGIRTERPAA